MSESTFCVVLTPALSGEISREQALDRLAGRFGMDRKRAEALLASAPRPIKKGLSRQKALRFQSVLRDCGLRARIEPENGPKEVHGHEPADRSERSSPPAVCPSCGYRAKGPQDPLLSAFNGMGQCPVCQIIVSKYKNAAADAGEFKDNTDDTAGAAFHPPLSDGPAAGEEAPAFSVFLQGRARNKRVQKLIAGTCLILFVLVCSILVKSQFSGSPQAGSPGGTAVSLRDEKRLAYRAAREEQRARTEEIETMGSHVPEEWFDEETMRISPGETWRGYLNFKLPLESWSFDLYSKNSPDINMYGDMSFEVAQNPWQDKNIGFAVDHTYISDYSFPIWVIAENGRVTHTLHSPDRSVSLEELGGMTREEVAEIDWPAESFPPGFDPLFDLSRGWGHGYRAELYLSVTVPETFADYKLGKYIANRAETIRFKDQSDKKVYLHLTVAKKKGDSGLYLKPGKKDS